MSPDSYTRYPTGHSFVLKLQRDAHPDAFPGRRENTATGSTADFAAGAQIVALLASEFSGASTGGRPERGERHGS